MKKWKKNHYYLAINEYYTVLKIPFASVSRKQCHFVSRRKLSGSHHGYAVDGKWDSDFCCYSTIPEGSVCKRVTSSATWWVGLKTTDCPHVQCLTITECHTILVFLLNLVHSVKKNAKASQPCPKRRSFDVYNVIYLVTSIRCLLYPDNTRMLLVLEVIKLCVLDKFFLSCFSLMLFEKAYRFSCRSIHVSSI